MTRVIWIVLAAQAVALAAGLTLAADVYAHKRTESVGGVNIWGYRGPVARQRQPGEVRLVFVGGTRTFGYGATAAETIPAAVRWMITLTTDVPGRPLRPVVAINLGRPGATAAPYAAVLRRYADLDPDLVVIYDDLGLEPARRARSRVFGWLGYAPALPLVLQEKGMAWRHGSVAAGYGAAAAGQTGALRAAAGASLQAAGRLLGAIDRGVPPAPAGTYEDWMIEAIDTARAQAAGVLVAVGPVVTAQQRANLAALNRRLAARGLASAHVRLLDLTTVATLGAPDLTLDGYNYNGEGRGRVAAAMVPPLLEWIQRLGA